MFTQGEIIQEANTEYSQLPKTRDSLQKAGIKGGDVILGKISGGGGGETNIYVTIDFFFIKTVLPISHEKLNVMRFTCVSRNCKRLHIRNNYGGFQKHQLVVYSIQVVFF